MLQSDPKIDATLYLGQVLCFKR